MDRPQMAAEGAGDGTTGASGVGGADGTTGTTGTTGTKELRLALVCYGGVSLAIYMHGVTREVQELLIASEAWRERDAAATNPFAAGDSKRAYFEALRRRSQAAGGVSTHVVVDIISGSSAGGIDGVFLAKAVAGDLSQAALKNLWLELGDIGKLLRGVGPVPLRAAWFALKAAVRKGDVKGPLKGDHLVRWIYDALAGMDQAPRTKKNRRTLVPQGQSLELFVTVTDSRGYQRFVTVTPGDTVLRDRTHRHVLHFSHPKLALGPPGADDGAVGQFGEDYNAALAFAARATSSFPGAFPPVSLDQFQKALRKKGRHRPVDLARLKNEFFAEYTAWEDDPSTAWFIDGGVLDNFPFGHAISAIQRKPAGSEVERVLLYIEPDPSRTPPAGTDGGTPRQAASVNWLQSIGRGLSIPSHEPILDDILSLRDRNERIVQVEALVADREPEVEARLDQLAQGWQNPESMSYADIQRLTTDLHDAAEEQLGIGLLGYLGLRLQSMAASASDAVAAAFTYPKTSSQASFVRECCRLWLRDRYGSAKGAQAREFYSTFDLPFRERRLRFVVQGINALYGKPGAPSRTELDRAKALTYTWMERLWFLPHRLRQTMSGAVGDLFGPKELKRWLETPREPRAFLDEKRDELGRFEAQLGEWITRELEGFGVGLWGAFNEATARFTPEARTHILARYLGFPVWDTVVFPIVALSGVEQFTPIRVRRMSPLDATALAWRGEKLQGAALHHFAAFFGRDRRENDYLWGRLDAVELLLSLVDPATPPSDLATAFTGVVDEEQRDLRILGSTEADSLGTRLREAIARLSSRARTSG